MRLALLLAGSWSGQRSGIPAGQRDARKSCERDGMMRTMCLLLSGSWDTGSQPIAAAEPEARVDFESGDGFPNRARRTAPPPVRSDAGIPRSPRGTLAA